MSTVAALLYVGGMITSHCWATDLVLGHPKMNKFSSGEQKAAIAVVAAIWVVYPIAVLFGFAWRAAKAARWPR